MYRAMVKRKARASYRALSRGDYGEVLQSFAPDGVLSFPGDHALGGIFAGREEIHGWFKRLYSVFPDLTFEPQVILVNGFPWDTLVATRFTVTASLSNGRPYTNSGMQFLRLRWGRIVEDVLYEDTQRVAAALTDVAN